MRWIILLLISLLLVPIVLADVSITNLPQSQYNYGESFKAEATVHSAVDFQGYMNLIAYCNSPITLATKKIDLKAGGTYNYRENFIVTDTFSGSCTLKLEKTNLNLDVLETTSTNSFQITNELAGEFNTNANTFQLGDKLELTGTILNINNFPINGLATVTIKKSSTPKFTETLAIVDSVLSYTKDLSMIPDGDYSIDIKASDSYGNSKTFTNAASFKLSGSLIINANLGETYNPGDTVQIKGTVKSENNKVVQNLEVQLVFEEDYQTVDLTTSNEEFTFSHKLKENVKSGKHNFIINTKDAVGNAGTKDFEININQIPTSLSTQVVSFNHLPEKDVEFEINILDQAGDIIPDTASVELIDPDDKKIDSKAIQTSTKESFTLPKFAAPGTWKLAFTAFELQQEINFEVQKLIKIETNIVGQKLQIKNIGNVDYDDDLHFISDGIDFFKAISVDVDDIDSIDLGSIIPEGNHKIEIPLTNDKYDPVIVTSNNLFDGIGDFFSNLGITSAAVFGGSTGSTIGVAIAFLIIISLIIFFFAKRAKKRKVRLEGEKNLGIKRKEQIKREFKKSGPRTYDSYNQSDTDYMKQQAVKAYEEQKNKPAVMGRGEYINATRKREAPKENVPNNGTIFDIFK